MDELDPAIGYVRYSCELGCYQVDRAVVVFTNAMGFNKRIDNQNVNLVLDDLSDHGLSRWV
jgi:hypothetical protein